MEIYKYKSYDHYVEEQIKANHRKIGKVWVSKDTIEYIGKFKKNIKRVICHGTRNGAEQKFFKQLYDCYVIGTEISDTASNYEDTVQWDFTKPKKQWENAFDVVYSNSFDHSIDPIATIKTWKGQLKLDGILVIEINHNDKSKSSDPLLITPKEFEKLVIDNSLYIISQWKKPKSTIFVLTKDIQ